MQISVARSSINADDKERDKVCSHSLLMNCAIQVLRHLGCPHGCSDGIRGPHADFCRSQAQAILNKLHKASSKQFSKFLRSMMRNQPITEILDFFHSFVGFCVDPSSLLSPLSKHFITLYLISSLFLIFFSLFSQFFDVIQIDKLCHFCSFAYGFVRFESVLVTNLRIY